MEFEFICNAIEFVADYGYLFLNEYAFNLHSGEWTHLNFDDTNFINKPDIKSILSSDLRNCFDEEIVDRNTEFPKYLTEANNIIKSLKNIKEYRQFEDPKIEELRWFNFAHINK